MHYYVKTVVSQYTSAASDTVQYQTNIIPGKSSAGDPNEGKKSLPTETALLKNYPDPFNPTTTIRYTLNEMTHVKLDIINVLGQVTQTLVDEVQEAGFQQVEFDASQYPSGLYFYHLKTEKYSDIKKMMLVR